MCYLHSNNFRDEFKAELSKKSVRLFNGEWDKVFIVNVKDSKNSIYIGKSIKDMAFKLDVDPVDFIFDLLAINSTLIKSPHVEFFKEDLCVHWFLRPTYFVFEAILIILVSIIFC